MAANNNSEQGKSRAGDGRRGVLGRNGVRSLLLIAAGASLGGVGVVAYLPEPEPVDELQQQTGLVSIKHPTSFEMSFNPRTPRGRSLAKVEFLFRYRVDAGDAAPAQVAIGERWDEAYSRAFLLLKQQTPDQLHSADGIRHLTKALADELTRTLFVDGIATVEEIVWKQILVQ